jgi:hypothetical protein
VDEKLINEEEIMRSVVIAKLMALFAFELGSSTN